MAVYPGHGVGRIEAIEERKIGDQAQAFYVMRILDSNMVIMVPVASSETVGLRSLIQQREVEKVFQILRQDDVQIPRQPWNQRYRDYMDRIRTGSVFKIATVLRDLHVLKEQKPLSFGERKMLDTAKTLLVRELAIANQVEEASVARDIDKIFS